MSTLTEPGTRAPESPEPAAPVPHRRIRLGARGRASLIGGYLLLIALVFVTINLVVDLLYYAVDPRLRVGRGASTGRA